MNVITPWYYLGYIVPHPFDDLSAYQFYRAAPDGMVLVTTGLRLKAYSTEAVENEMGNLKESLEILEKRGVDRIFLGGVPVAARLGRERVLKLLNDAHSQTGIVCDTTLEAIVSSMHHCGIKEIVIASRWADDLIKAVIDYLSGVGIEVISYLALGRNMAQNQVPNASADHESALEMGSRLLTENPSAQALLMPGGRWFAVHAAAMLQEKFNKPVFINITSAIWAALHADKSRMRVNPDSRWFRLFDGL
jgi:maleate cis-trans isomerase